MQQLREEAAGSGHFCQAAWLPAQRATMTLGSPLYSLLPDLLRFASLSCLQPSPSITPPPASQVGASQCPVLHVHAAACPG